MSVFLGASGLGDAVPIINKAMILSFSWHSNSCFKIGEFTHKPDNQALSKPCAFAAN